MGLITQFSKVLLSVCVVSLAFPTIGAGKPLEERHRVYKVIKRLAPKLPNKTAHKLSVAFLKASNHESCDIAWPILVGVGFRESKFKVGVVGISGDLGVMQVSPTNVRVRKLNRKLLLTDPHYNIKVGCQILTEHKTRYKGRHPYWLGTYNAGPSKKKLAFAKKYATIVRYIIIEQIGYKKVF